MENVLVTSKEFMKNNRPYIEKEMEKYSDFNVLFNPNEGAMNEESLIRFMQENHCVGLLVYSSSDEVTARVMTECKDLRVISRHGVGLENIDRNAAEEKGIRIYNTSNAHDNEAVADWVFSCMLALGRKLCQFNEQLTCGEWNRIPRNNIFGKTIGIIGFGRIGQAVARRAAGFQMKILVAESANSAGRTYPDYVEVVSMETLLAESDFVSLHSVVTEETRGMIGAEQFAKMKSSAYLINSGRSALVRQKDLIEALENGIIAGAAVDVYDNEPSTDDPLFQCKNNNLICTPHIGIYTVETLREIDVLAMSNLLSNLT